MQVIDGFLNTADFNKIRDEMLSTRFPYFISDEINYNSKPGDPEYYMLHMIYENHKPNSGAWDLIQPILNNLIDLSCLIRMKVNFYPRSEKIIEHPEHRDLDFEHKGFILYLNDNDGYTKIGDKKVESKANRALLFNSFLPHQSTTCTNDYGRFNINMNYL